MHLPPPFRSAATAAEAGDPLLGELVDYLNENRPTLQAEWTRRVIHRRLLHTPDRAEIDRIADTMFDGYVAALAQSGLAGLRAFLAELPEFLRPLGVGNRDAPDLASLLRDVCGRSLFGRFRHYEGRPAESGRAGPDRRPAWPGVAPVLQPS